MMLADRTIVFRSLAAVVLCITAACSDRGANEPATPKRFNPNARFTISDGAHGGNKDVFFLPPMVANPHKAPGYGDPFQAGLNVAIKVKDNVTSAYVKAFSGSSVGVNTVDQYYYVDWDTKATTLDDSHTYRIEVWIENRPQPFAFADVVLAPNAAGLKNVDTQQDIPLVDGRTLPIHVRVEKGWCSNNGTATCTTEVVPASIAGGGSVTIATPDNLNSLKLTGNWANTGGTVVVTIENATNTVNCQGQTTDVVLAANQCIKITMDPQVTLQTPATVGLCSFLPVDQRELAVKYDVNEVTQFLDDAPPPIPCPTQTASRSSNPLVRLASAAASGIGRLLGIKPAYAFDTGVGADLTIGTTFSYFSPAYPMQMSIVSGDNQSGFAGVAAANALRVKVSYVHHVGDNALPDAVLNANVVCPAASGGGSATPVGGGVYQCAAPVLAFGANALKVYIPTVADPIQLNTGNGQHVMLPQSVTFSATGLAFTDGFEGQFAWTATPFWNVSTLSGNNAPLLNSAFPRYVSAAGTDNSGALPSPRAGGYAVWYGQAAAGNYMGTQIEGDSPGSGGTSVGPNSGTLTTPIISLPASTAVNLGFDTWWEIESVNPSHFDVMSVSVRDVASGAVVTLGQLNPGSDPGGPATVPFTSGGYNLAPVWTHVTQDLSGYAGKQVQIIFTFNTVDRLYNGFRGWVVDNVVVSQTGGATIARVGSGQKHLSSRVTAIGLNPALPPGAPRTP